MNTANAKTRLLAQAAYLKGDRQGARFLVFKPLLVNSCSPLGGGFAHEGLPGSHGIALPQGPANRQSAMSSLSGLCRGAATIWYLLKQTICMQTRACTHLLLVGELSC